VHRAPLNTVKFVLALGNRPKSERIAHVITLWCASLACYLGLTESRYVRVYALLAIYLVVCSIALTVKAFAVSS